MMDDFSYDEWDSLQEEEYKPPRDKVVDDAKQTLRQFFDEKNEDVFHFQNIEVIFEKKYFHWITSRALGELIKEGSLKCEELALFEKSTIKFVFNRKYRYYKRKIKEKIVIVRKYSDPVIAQACGLQAEMLFYNALVQAGFKPLGKNINWHGERKWEETNHDLDYIIEMDNIAYGAEVKNKFRYIDKSELDIKLRMCEYLGLKPLFIARMAPKHYINMVNKNGGYTLVFVTQIYPYGSGALVAEIEKTLGLPVICPKAIPEGMIERFKNWHKKQLKSV